MYKFMKIVPFPEQLFYMDRMVGYDQEPKMLIQIEREYGTSNSVRVTFRAMVKVLSGCDHSKTIRKRVSVSLVSILGEKSEELTERIYTGHTESYRLLSNQLKQEIEQMLNQQMNETVLVLASERLDEWLSLSLYTENSSA